MKNKLLALIALFVGIAVPASARISASHGIANLRIAVQGSNVLLFWPSLTNQAFYIQHAPDLNPGTPWTTIAAKYPAAEGTNWTSFIHSNSVTFPTGCPTNSGGSGGGPAPSPSNSIAVQGQDGNTYFVTQGGEVLTYEDFLPYPWNPRFAPKPQAVDQNTASAQSLQTQSGESSSSESGLCAPTMGFYRVFIPASRALGDVFSVGQNSRTNQLSILANDSDPEEGLFLISNVVSAANGSIQFTITAEPFWYTPATNFFGMDSFHYGLTNDIGGFSGTNVWVFVNKTGNANPVAAPLTYTLLSNQTQVSFPALTNATDANGNPLFVALLFQPAHGNATTNANGTITYTANTNRIASDSFTYVIAETNGGMVQRTVTIQPQDSDGDGMPNAWETQNGLNPSTSDYNSDADGDGLRNLAEYRLGTNPQATNSPLILSVVSNSIIEGFVSFPLPGVHPDIGAEAITLYVNGAPAADSFLSQRADGQWQLHWHTLFTTNGTYSVRARFHVSENGITNITFGPQTSVIVSNRIRVNPLTRAFTDFVLLDYRLTTSNSNYRIDLYDDYGTPLVYAEGSTTNGRIYLYWDLKNGAGQRIVFGNLRAGIVLSTGTGFTGSSSRPIFLWYNLERGSPATSFAVAWGHNAYGSSFNNDREQMMLDAVINILGNPAEIDSYTLEPAAFNVPYARSFRYDSESDKKVLIQALKDSNNFFWLGHGDFNGIAGNDTNSTLASADVQLALQNFGSMATPKKPRTDKHPYKLTILNGCTTYSSSWASAFGVPFSANGSTNYVSDYQFVGREPRAFVGWTGEIDVPVGSLRHSQYGEALAYMFSYWMGGFPLDWCLDEFSDIAQPNFANANTWKISGCVDLTRGD